MTTVHQTPGIPPSATLPFTAEEFEARTPVPVLAEQICRHGISSVAAFMDAAGYPAGDVAEFSRLQAQRWPSFDGHTEASCAAILNASRP
jgi:hypothetical protein